MGKGASAPCPPFAHHSDGGHASVFARGATADKSPCPASRLLLVHWAGEGSTKALRFAPRLTNLVPKTSELVCYVDDDECDHGYRPALTSKRLI
jgi:hypothetical protein